MIYLLGGPPRVGKSIISKTITADHGVNVVSTDTLGAVLEAVLGPELAPDLFAVSRLEELTLAERIALMAEDTPERIRCQVREGHAVWKGVEPLVIRESDEHRDVLVEGVAVLPELVRRLHDVQHRAVFIGNQGADHSRNIKRAAAENPHDWMRGASDKYIDAFAIFVAQMSRYVEKEALSCGFEYIEMGQRPFDDALALVVEALVG
jgi:2-phosphoglycerate kinase